MRTKSLLIFIPLLLAACSSKKNISAFDRAIFTQKDTIMMENNNMYSSASVIGGAAQIVKQEKEKIRGKQIAGRNEKIREIVGVSLDSLKDQEGNQKFRVTVQNDVLFKTGSFQLSDSATVVLQDLAKAIVEVPDTKVSVIGHTDNVAGKEYNLMLSKNRAASVGNFLRSAGFKPENITETGKGFSQPIADNKTEAGRAKNRRVEIILE